MRPAAYDPVARIADMDRAGMLASLCFPTLPRFCGQIFWEAKDKDLAMAAAFTFLREKGAFPEDDGDDSDDMIFGDDDNLDDYE